MRKYDVVLRAEYEKTLFVYAENEEEAREKVEMLPFDTNVITFGNENFIAGEAEITEKYRCNEMEFCDKEYADEISFSEGSRESHKSKTSRRS